MHFCIAHLHFVGVTMRRCALSSSAWRTESPPRLKESLVMETSNIVLVMVGLSAVAANGVLDRAAASISGMFSKSKATRRPSSPPRAPASRHDCTAPTR
jgi:hypothetical protein